MNVPADPQFVSDMQAAMAKGQQLPPDLIGKFNLAVDNRVAPALDSGMLSGEDYQQVMRGLKGYKAETAAPGFEEDYRNALSDVQDSLTGTMNRNGGDEVVAGLNAANNSYNKFKVLENSVKRAKNGSLTGMPEQFAPSQLNDAAEASRFNQGGVNRPFYDLGTAGQAVLPSKIADSGTAGRLALGGLLTGASALGGGAGYMGGDTAGGAETGAGFGLGAMGLMAGLNTKAGQKALTLALLKRPDLVRQAGNGLLNYAPVLGQAGAGAAAPLLMQNAQ